MRDAATVRETKIVREEIGDLQKYLKEIPDHLRKNGAFDAYYRRLIQLTTEFFEGQEFKSLVVREEIEDLRQYLKGIPDGLRKNSTFDSYDRRLVQLTRELLENEDFKNSVLLEEITDINNYLTSVPGNLKRNGAFNAYYIRLIQLTEELFGEPKPVPIQNNSLTTATKPNIKESLDLDELANLENSISELSDIIIACHQIEQPKGLLLEAVERNMSRGIRYSFLISRSSFNSEKDSYYQIFLAIAKIVSVKYGVRKVEDLIRIKALRTEWKMFPTIFYKTIKDAKDIEATIVYRGTETEKGICTRYNLVDIDVASMLYDLIVSAVDWTGDMQKEIMSLNPSEFISPEEYAQRFL
jgi:hypothetical protein